MKSTASTEETKPATITLAPNPENRCFGCGGANDAGMKLMFVQDNERRRIVGRFVLSVEYLKPVSVQDEIIVEGWEEGEQKGRNLFHVGEIRNSAGDVLARGKARFVIIGEKRV